MAQFVPQESLYVDGVQRGGRLSTSWGLRGRKDWKDDMGRGGERCRGGRGGVGVWFFPSSNELTADGTQQYLCQLREVPPQGGAGGGIGN